MKFEIHPSANSQFYWRIVAGNGQVLAHSETYTTKQACLNAINVVKREASTARVVDFAGVR